MFICKFFINFVVQNDVFMKTRKEISLIKTLVLIYLLHFSPVFSFGQFNETGQQAILTNIKYLSQDETMALTKCISQISVVQSKQLYLVNLDINRRFFSTLKNIKAIDKTSKIFLQSQTEKEKAYKKILTPEQFVTYQQIIHKDDHTLVNNKNISVSDYDADGKVFSSR